MRNETGSGFQLEGSAPEAYEAYLVPTLFDECARHLIEAASTHAGDRVADVARGMGIVGRQATVVVPMQTWIAVGQRSEGDSPGS